MQVIAGWQAAPARCKSAVVLACLEAGSKLENKDELWPELQVCEPSVMSMLECCDRSGDTYRTIAFPAYTFTNGESWSWVLMSTLDQES